MKSFTDTKLKQLKKQFHFTMKKEKIKSSKSGIFASKITFVIIYQSCCRINVLLNQSTNSCSSCHNVHLSIQNCTLQNSCSSNMCFTLWKTDWRPKATEMSNRWRWQQHSACRASAGNTMCLMRSLGQRLQSLTAKDVKLNIEDFTQSYVNLFNFSLPQSWGL